MCRILCLFCDAFCTHTVSEIDMNIQRCVSATHNHYTYVHILHLSILYEDVAFNHSILAFNIFQRMLKKNIIAIICLLTAAVQSISTVSGPNTELGTLHVFIQDRSTTHRECDLHEVPANERCSYIQSECGHYKLGFVNYLEIYYCTLHQHLSSFAFFPVMIELGLLFVSIGLTASDYLCPNLYTISKGLKLSDNLAGLTLLALGNGAPDVLTTYTALNLGSQDLAVSELIGAAFFITTIVIGTMGIINPFQVTKNAFLRDLSFFLVILAIVLGFIIEGKLSFFYCIVLVGLYIAYVVVVISSHSITKAKIKHRKRELRSRGNYSRNSDTITNRSEYDADANTIFLDDFDRLPSIEQLDSSPIKNSDTLLSPALVEEGDEIGDADVAEEDASNENEEDDFSSGRYGVTRLLHKLQTHSNHRIKLNDEDYISAGSEVSSPTNFVCVPEGSSRYSTGATSYTYGTFPFFKIFFPNFDDFEEMDFKSKFHTIFLSPIVFLLRVTNPVRDQACFDSLRERERSKFDKLGLESLENQENETDLEFDFVLDKTLLLIQNFGSNVFVTYIWFRKGDVFWSQIFPASIVVSLLITVCTYLLYNRDTSNIRLVYYISTLLGFISSMTWISIFATEVIGILKIFSLIYNVSDEILGTTIFALGNSVSDLISNFTIAKMGMPLMAFGACFGGPLLTFSSLGFTGLLYMLSNENNTGSHFELLIPFDLNSSLVITHLGLILNLIFLMIAVPRNDWYIDKTIGYISIAIWIISTTISVIIEVALG